MNKDTHVVGAHTAAAQEHETTAKSHRTAADHCSKGNHEGCELSCKSGARSFRESSRGFDARTR